MKQQTALDLNQRKPQLKCLVFPSVKRERLDTLLAELDVKKNRAVNRRTFYSRRHTCISMRLLESADIYQVAKNCRASVEMIKKLDAAHIKDMIDAEPINVRKKPKRKAPKSAAD